MRPTPFAVLAAAALAVAACSKEIPTREDLTPTVPASPDADAGSWRMIALSGPSQFPVAPPAPASSEAYQAEVAAVKTAQAGLTDAQRENVDYWAGGGVLRWNQFMRELVARYNLPPAPRADGTYPAPDAANPFADPQFPFANPPYAARAYAYVAVAQYDALKAAWHYKYLYNRPAPSQVDGGVQALLPASGTPAYPSEDAVLSGVSAEMLKLLFPAAVDEITRKAASQREAAVLGGRATASDVAAGLALGNAVAGALVARAAGDGMRTAGGTPAQWAAYAAAAEARGEVAWKSLEDPPRPPMLANFGKVQAWMMTPADVVNERAPSPPSTSSEQMRQELAEVKSVSENLSSEQLAIAQLWNDGAATPTPPGHWNDIASEHVHRAGWSEVRAARAFALLNMAMHDAAVVCWETKFHYFNPRPSQLDPSIKTKIGLPNFPAYVSGHSTFSASAAAVLSHLFPSSASSFAAMRDEAAASRLYAAIHYRSDIEAGVECGDRVGGYTVAFARADGAD
jgi:membrane-associated phospholipid phosphatase